MATETTNRPVRKTAAIIGFVALLVLIAGLSIIIVRNVPNSFASLASLAQSVRGFDTAQTASVIADSDEPTPVRGALVVTSDTNVINHDDTVYLSWNEASAPGSFVFSYACIDGVTMTIIDTEGVRNIMCDVNYNIGDANKLTVNVESGKKRFVDVPYSIAFLETDATVPAISDDATLTIVNEMVPLVFDDAETDTMADASGVVAGVSDSTVFEPESAPLITPEPEIDQVSETPVVTESPEPADPAETLTAPIDAFEQEFAYTIPVSDPEGRIDLSTNFVGYGSIVNGAFSNTIELNNPRAIQFTVINLGNKTSDTWTYATSLPNGNNLTSDEQAPLGPNERSTVTIGFPASDEVTFDFSVNIDTTNDNFSLNNQFVEAVILN